MMSPAEHKLAEFVAMRLESMLQKPDIWGGSLSVEEKLLQLLEVRRILLDPSAAPSNNTNGLMRGYTRFLNRELPGATAEPLAIQLEQRGRSAALSALLRKFIEEDFATYVATRSDGPAEPIVVPNEESAESLEDKSWDKIERIVQVLRKQSLVERPRAGAPRMPFLFPRRAS